MADPRAELQRVYLEQREDFQKVFRHLLEQFERVHSEQLQKHELRLKEWLGGANGQREQDHEPFEARKLAADTLERDALAALVGDDRAPTAPTSPTSAHPFAVADEAAPAPPQVNSPAPPREQTPIMVGMVGQEIGSSIDHGRHGRADAQEIGSPIDMVGQPSDRDEVGYPSSNQNESTEDEKTAAPYSVTGTMRSSALSSVDSKAKAKGRKKVVGAGRTSLEDELGAMDKRLKSLKNTAMSKLTGKKAKLHGDKKSTGPGLKRAPSSLLPAGLVGRSVSALDEEQEKDEECSMRCVLNSAITRTMVSVIILLNVLLMGIRVELKLGSQVRDDYFDKESWQWTEIVFTLFFLIELMLRVAAERRNFIHGDDRNWNLVDTFLVGQACFDVMFDLTETANVPNLSWLRALRILRFARILRLIRVVKAFHSLKVMVYSISLSILSMVWVWLLMSFMIYGFALIFMFGVEQYFEAAENVHSETGQVLKAQFGSLYGSMTTLFMTISGGVDWRDVWVPLSEMSAGYSMVFTLYIFFFTIGVLNIVTSLFVEQAHQASMRDREMLVEYELEQEKRWAASLGDFFREADEDESGMLSEQELSDYLQDEAVKAYFSSLKLDVSEAKRLFTLLDGDDSGEVGIDEFIDGCSKLRGNAKSIDVNMLIHETQTMLAGWEKFQDAMAEQFARLEAKLSHESA